MEYKIISKLSTLMGSVNANIKDVSIGTGLDRMTISNLKNNTAKRIDYDTLSALCKYFIGKGILCTPGDILELVEIKKEEDL